MLGSVCTPLSKQSGMICITRPLDRICSAVMRVMGTSG
jgi:hypothetical protein